MFSGLFKTKTFWVGLATALGGVATVLGSGVAIDFSSITAIIDSVQAIAGTDGWEAIMLGLAIITGRHAISKMGK